MSIHTRWGGEVPVTVVANAGLQKAPYFNGPMTLVKVEYTDNLTRRWYWAEMLKASEGWPEIKAALEAAPPIEVKGAALRKAFNEAE